MIELPITEPAETRRRKPDWLRVKLPIGEKYKHVRNLVDIASKGGNYLLNVSPTGAGVILPQAVERLKQIGEWMKINSESIYGTTGSPFKPT